MVDSNNIDVIRQNIRELAKTQDPTVISGLITNVEANTDAIGDINALVGSTPLPAGETITHMLVNSSGGGGVDYSTTEQEISIKGVNGEKLYQKSYTGDLPNAIVTVDANIKGSTVNVYSYSCIATKGEAIEFASINSQPHIFDVYISSSGLQINPGEIISGTGATYLLTIIYSKKEEE